MDFRRGGQDRRVFRVLITLMGGVQTGGFIADAAKADIGVLSCMAVAGLGFFATLVLIPAAVELTCDLFTGER